MRRIRLVALLAVAGMLVPMVAAAPAAAATYATPSQYVNRAISWTGWTRSQIWSGSSGPWCGKFVSKIATDVNVRPTAISRTADSATESQVFPNSSWALKRSGYTAKTNSSYAPRVGDLVFITKDPWNTITHVGIIQGWDGTNLYTVEGNPPFYGSVYGADDVAKVTRRMYTYNSSFSTFVLSGQTLVVSLSLPLTPSSFSTWPGSPAQSSYSIRVVDIITPNW